MWIQREITEQLIQLAQQRPAIFLSGARQTGKSSLLKKIFSQHAYVSLDHPSDAAMAEENPEQFLEQNLQGKMGVILDEVQYAPSITRYLKILIDRDRNLNGRFILTSSQIFETIQNLSESLAGRISIQRLYPLSQHELLLGAKKTSGNLIRGFYPELVANSELNSDDFFRSYIQTYLERDLRSLLAVKDLRIFDRFLRALSTRVGSLINASDISRDVGVSSPTISEWLSILQQTGIGIFLEPYSNNRDKRWTKSSKIYFNDTGLLSYLLKINEKNILDHPLGDKVWENFVVLEYIKRINFLSPKSDVFFLRDAHGKEVDLLIESESKISLIEIKHKERPNEKDAENLHLHQTSLKLNDDQVAKSIACLTRQISALSNNVRIFNPLKDSLI